MTTITPDHDSGICHAASEKRRQVLEQLKELANQLENCEIETKQQAGIQSAACSSPCYYPCGNPDCPPCFQPAKSETLPLQGRYGGGRQSGGGRHCGGPLPGNQQGRGDMPHATNLQQGPVQKNAGFSGCSQGQSPDEFAFAGHMFENRFVKPDPSKIPLMVYPDYPPHKYKPRTPPERTDLNKKSNSRELLNGTLLSGCDCVKRNGLQDQCRRVECRGRPECLIKPEPECIPSKVTRGHHKEVQAHKDAQKEEKEQQKQYLPVCCKCPSDCWKKKQQKAQQVEDKLLREIQNLCRQQSAPIRKVQCQERFAPQQKQCQQQYEPQQQQYQQRYESQQQERQQRQAPQQHNEPQQYSDPVYVCFPPPDCSEQVMKGQFQRNLRTQEIDPLRGPLMNR